MTLPALLCIYIRMGKPMKWGKRDSPASKRKAVDVQQEVKPVYSIVVSDSTGMVLMT